MAREDRVKALPSPNKTFKYHGHKTNLVVPVVKIYKLVCSPNSEAIEKEVNKLLETYPDSLFHFLQPTTGPYFKREPEMRCLKCASEVFEANGQYACSSCKRAYTADEFAKHSKIRFTQAGTLFLQPLVIEKNEEATEHGH